MDQVDSDQAAARREVAAMGPLRALLRVVTGREAAAMGLPTAAAHPDGAEAGTVLP
jgi:hypothetical protein